MSKDATIYQLRIHLQDIRPTIWRRILVPGSTRLSDLHEILQRAMPWLGYHMYQFIDGAKHSGTLYSIPYDDDNDFDREVNDARKVSVRDIAPTKGNKFLYEYDFGDDWFHEIRVEKILSPQPGVRYPVCLEGARATPPEDCGGPWGYEELLGKISDPKHKEYKELKQWAESLIGHAFDSERFDLDAINHSLSKLRLPRRRGVAKNQSASMQFA